MHADQRCSSILKQEHERPVHHERGLVWGWAMFTSAEPIGDWAYQHPWHTGRGSTLIPELYARIRHYDNDDDDLNTLGKDSIGEEGMSRLKVRFFKYQRRYVLTRLGPPPTGYTTTPLLVGNMYSSRFIFL